MKFIKTILLVLIFTACGLTQSQEKKTENLVESDPVFVEPADFNRYQEIYDQNKDLQFPNLDYWGIKSFLWMTPININLLKSKNMNFTKSVDGSYIASEMLENKSFKIRISQNKKNTINQVEYYYSSLNKGELLTLFEKLRDRADKAYNGPTNNIKPQQFFQGKDAYLSGYIDGYLVEYIGQQTSIIIELKNDELDIVYKLSTSSTAEEINKKIKIN